MWRLSFFFLLVLASVSLLALSRCAMQEKRASSAAVQKYGWTRSMGGASYKVANAICADSSGNVYVAGVFQESVVFGADWGGSDTKVSAGRNDIFITKMGAAGNYLWTRRIGGESDDSASAICTDGSGNVYVAGVFRETVNFAADWGGNDTKRIARFSDIFLTKIGTEGNYLWTRKMGASEVHAICADGSGNVYVAGTFNGTVNFAKDWGKGDTKASAGLYDAFVTKVGANGNYFWTRRMGGRRYDATTNANAVCADGTGNIYVAGRFCGSVNFAEDWGGSDTKVSVCKQDWFVGADDIFITRIDADGNYSWTRRMGGLDVDVANAICADRSSNIYVAGWFMGTSNFAEDWGSSDTKVSTGYHDIFIIKIDADGSYIWTHRMGGEDADVACAVCTDGSGNIYVAGRFVMTVDFAADWGRSDTKVSAGYDIFITKIDVSGNYVWTHRIGGWSWDEARAICSDKSGNVYVAGFFCGAVNFAADWGGSDTKASAGEANIFVTKIGR